MGGFEEAEAGIEPSTTRRMGGFVESANERERERGGGDSRQE